MPIYEFRCECGIEDERYLLLSKRNQVQVCECGKILQRKISLPLPPIVPLTPRDKVLKSLNKEDGFGLPGGEEHRTRYEQTIAQGLDPPRSTTGKGF